MAAFLFSFQKLNVRMAKTGVAIHRRGMAQKNESSSSSSDSSEDEKVEEIRDKRLARITSTNTSERRKALLEHGMEGKSNEKLHNDNNSPPVSKDIVSYLPPKSESSSEYTSEESSDSDSKQAIPLARPVYVPKQSRETVEPVHSTKEKGKVQKDADMLIMKKKAEDLLLDVLRREQEELQVVDVEFEVDDTDGLNEEEEFNAWRLRELLRIKRDSDEKESRLVDKADIMRRRMMSDNQVEVENTIDGKLGVEKAKAKFLQKYYHKGAFYVDDEVVGEALKKTDAFAPTLEDHADKSTLPSILQVKNFGKRGRTKYTHLVDQDTTGV